MFHRALTTAALVACVGVQVWTAEHATVILTDGSRQSGDVVFHGSSSRNIIDNQFNLRQGGHEQSIPIEQVAIIDYPTGRNIRRVTDAGTNTYPSWSPMPNR